MMTRRSWIAGLAAAAAASADGTDSIRGRLKPGAPGVLNAPGGAITLDGDPSTRGVLADARLDGADLELIGRRRTDGTFEVNPIHLKAMFVHREGKRLMISYWCDVCSIRTYTPGICACCQDETALDLKESFNP